MKNCSPIYNLLHQEIRTCAERLLQIGQTMQLSQKTDTGPILECFSQLHHFSKATLNEYYEPLNELKHYLETTMLCYLDDKKNTLTIRLSEAIALLPLRTDIGFKPALAQSLTECFRSHFQKNTKPGHPLFRKLTNIKQM